MASLERAEGKGNEREVQGAIREARHSLELVGGLDGSLQETSREAAPMTSNQYIILLGKMFSEDELRKMAAGEGTLDEHDRFRKEWNDENTLDAHLLTVEGKSHVVEPD